jgi:hypothetical protein
LRFRVVLSIPGRNLSALEDFDRSLTESNVRLYAGALLEIIKDDLAHDKDVDEDVGARGNRRLTSGHG